MDRNNTEHEGERYLHLLGLDHLADNDVPTATGTIKARDFLDICGPHARPILVGFETMTSDDPRYEPTRNALRNLIGQYIEGQLG